MEIWYRGIDFHLEDFREKSLGRVEAIVPIPVSSWYYPTASRPGDEHGRGCFIGRSAYRLV
jgi:hypothetical protein